MGLAGKGTSEAADHTRRVTLFVIPKNIRNTLYWSARSCVRLFDATNVTTRRHVLRSLIPEYLLACALLVDRSEGSRNPVDICTLTPWKWESASHAETMVFRISHSTVGRTPGVTVASHCSYHAHGLRRVLAADTRRVAPAIPGPCRNRWFAMFLDANLHPAERIRREQQTSAFRERGFTADFSHLTAGRPYDRKLGCVHPVLRGSFATM